MITVLIVNDSITVQHLLKRVIALDAELSLVGITHNGRDAIDQVKTLNPDVVLMDIRMPTMDGVEAVRRIMSESPCPILIVTATFMGHMAQIYDCLGYGALDVIKTPSLSGQELVAKIRSLAEFKKTIQKKKLPRAWSPEKQALNPSKGSPGKSAKRVVAIGASIGGPMAILSILRDLSKDLPAAVVIVQHIDFEFAPGLAEWLQANGLIPVLTAQEGEILLEGKAYLATAADKNMTVAENGKIRYQEPGAEFPIIPSIDVTFASIAEHYREEAIGILLTGMGRDGAEGLKRLSQNGAVTLAQDEASSLIYGMPKAAQELGAAQEILPLERIGPRVRDLLGLTDPESRRKNS